MGISDRCRELNLYNHLKQKKVNITHKFILLKNVNKLESMHNEILNLEDYKKYDSDWSRYIDKNLWLCIVTIDNKQYLSLGKKQKEALVTILNKNQDFFITLLN
tara:strand:+ start:100 stop:411 length:312 start_codon:yes stop_codon:yes gene_type:complete